MASDTLTPFQISLAILNPSSNNFLGPNNMNLTIPPAILGTILIPYPTHLYTICTNDTKYDYYDDPKMIIIQIIITTTIYVTCSTIHTVTNPLLPSMDIMLMLIHFLRQVEPTLIASPHITKYFNSVWIIFAPHNVLL